MATDGHGDATDREGSGWPLARRAAVVLLVVSLFVLLWLFLWHARGFVLLVFAGILLAVFLDGIASWLEERTPLPRKATLAVLAVLLPGLLVLLGWLVGPRIVEEFGRLGQEIPTSYAQLRDFLADKGWGDEVLSVLPSRERMTGSGWDLLGRVTGIFSTTLGVLVNVFIVAFVGFYLALQPTLYKGAILRLVSPARRERGREVMATLGTALRHWLMGRLASMVAIALLTAVALLLLGIPLVLGLSVFAGLVTFVPYIGPVVAALPAMLIAWNQEPMLALWVGLTYWGIQLLETYLITPLIQRYAVSMPPALLITSQILMGLVAGIPGVLLAAPLAVAVVVLVQLLYVEDVLGEEVSIMGE